jgi:hypothetical protein
MKSASKHGEIYSRRMRVLEPHTITVLTTDKCTAECRHCCMNSAPSREHRLTYEQMETALRDVFLHNDIKVVVFAGGEPTLLGDDLLRAISFCRLHGVVTRIITNAYWATSLPAARDKCRALREAGLEEFNVSTDDYHEPYIPLQHVKWAYEAAMELDFSAVVIANCMGPESMFTPEYLDGHFDMSGMTMQRRFDVNGGSNEFERQEAGKLLVISNAHLQRLGRGSQLIDEGECGNDVDIATVPPEVEMFGGCPYAARSPAISPRNHLVACCGFELHGNPVLDFGDLAEHGANDLLTRADDDLITNMIALIGPPKIMQLLKQLCPDEVSFPRARYNSYCETCQDLVGIEQNRRALYKYQGFFAEAILEARAQLGGRLLPNGRVDNMPIKLTGLRVENLRRSPDRVE